jgi:hypothetical protein
MSLDTEVLERPQRAQRTRGVRLSSFAVALLRRMDAPPIVQLWLALRHGSVIIWLNHDQSAKALWLALRHGSVIINNI